jgi:hypothetical protein
MKLYKPLQAAIQDFLTDLLSIKTDNLVFESIKEKVERVHLKTVAQVNGEIRFLKLCGYSISEFIPSKAPENLTPKLTILELRKVPYPDKKTLVNSIFKHFPLLKDVKIGFHDYVSN